jgi:hypothetical protein
LGKRPKTLCRDVKCIIPGRRHASCLNSRIPAKNTFPN